MSYTGGNLLARVRKKNGFTQEKLARKSGLSIKTIQLWEMKGTKNANIAKLSKAADVLGVDIFEILC